MDESLSVLPSEAVKDVSTSPDMTRNHSLKRMKARLFTNICAIFALVLSAASIARAQVFSTSIVSAEMAMAVQHGSSLIELDDGSLLVSWYGGSKEGARDSRIWCAIH